MGARGKDAGGKRAEGEEARRFRRKKTNEKVTAVCRIRPP